MRELWVSYETEPGDVGGMGDINLTTRFVAGLLVAAGLVALIGCATDHDPQQPAEPSFYNSLASADAKVDAGMAATMISGYRTNNGLSSVQVDPELVKLADAKARAMAARDKIEHNVLRDFNARMRSSGFDAKVAAENIGAGYHTLAQAFSGWRDSPPHRKNMLLPGATHIGIATAYAPQSKYKVFWALILAAPDRPRG
jgi:uncharacterized protein YkwD